MMRFIFSSNPKRYLIVVFIAFSMIFVMGQNVVAQVSHTDENATHAEPNPQQETYAQQVNAPATVPVEMEVPAAVDVPIEQLREDIATMGIVIKKLLDERLPGRAVPSDLFREGIQGWYIEGLGVVFTCKVNFDVTNIEKETEETENSQVQDLWDEARQSKQKGQSPKTTGRKHRGVFDWSSEGEDRAVTLNKLDDAILTAIHQYGHRIRGINDDEQIIVTVFGAPRGEGGNKVLGMYGFGMMGGDGAMGMYGMGGPMPMENGSVGGMGMGGMGMGMMGRSGYAIGGMGGGSGMIMSSPDDAPEPAESPEPPILPDVTDQTLFKEDVKEVQEEVFEAQKEALDQQKEALDQQKEALERVKESVERAKESADRAAERAKEAASKYKDQIGRGMMGFFPDNSAIWFGGDQSNQSVRTYRVVRDELDPNWSLDERREVSLIYAY